MSLKSRQLFIPNGFTFVQPETGWVAPRMVSFDTVVNSLIAHRKANAFLAQKHNWATDFDSVAVEVDNYNAAVCAQMGWSDYITTDIGALPPPKSRPPSQSEQNQVSAAGAKSKKIWAGVKTLNDWIDSGEPAVSAELSAARAAACMGCPQNGRGDFTKWFTGPASEAIRRQIGKLSDRKLATPSDEKIDVCEVCLCPLKLKVHTPFDFIKAHLSKEIATELRAVPGCWIIKELDA
jgi:hypothetical protein